RLLFRHGARPAGENGTAMERAQARRARRHPREDGGEIAEADGVAVILSAKREGSLSAPPVKRSLATLGMTSEGGIDDLAAERDQPPRRGLRVDVEADVAG